MLRQKPPGGLWVVTGKQPPALASYESSSGLAASAVLPPSLPSVQKGHTFNRNQMWVSATAWPRESVPPPRTLHGHRRVVGRDTRRRPTVSVTKRHRLLCQCVLTDA